MLSADFVALFSSMAAYEANLLTEIRAMLIAIAMARRMVPKAIARLRLPFDVSNAIAVVIVRVT